MTVNYVVASDQSGIIVPLYRNGRGFGATFFTLTKKQMADLLETKREIAGVSKKEKGRTFYIDVDVEGECSIADTFTKNQSIAAYENGIEIPLPSETSTTTTVSKKPAKKSRSGKVVVGSGKKKPSKKLVKKIVSKKRKR